MKIRVWDLTAKEWIRSLDFINYLVKTTKVNTAELIIDSGGENFKVCLFTGLTDKNSKEICEGDILSIPDHNPPEYSNAIVVMEFHDTGWYYKDSDTKKLEAVDGLIGRTDKDESAEIIGNIFENPELLK